MNEQLKRLRWQCRRGMLELDLLFLPFVDHVFGTMSQDEQRVFERLLKCNDQELYNWLIKHELVEDKELQAMVERVRNAPKPHRVK